MKTIVYEELVNEFNEILEELILENHEKNAEKLTLWFMLIRRLDEIKEKMS